MCERVEPEPSEIEPPAEGSGSGARSSRVGWIAVLPAVAGAIAFLPVLGSGSFVNWDDPDNFLDNPYFRGLGWAQIRWAWTTFLVGVYQPLGWMLLEVQYALFGLHARGYHAASLWMHVVNSAVLGRLVAALLERCLPPESREDRRAIGRASALAAALFAAHPLRTEVVAWVSSQSYLPSTFFAMLSVLAYLRAHETGRIRHSGWLVASLLLYAAAILSKAVAVTLPAVLLILDGYPLRRLRYGPGSSVRGVLLEKVPFCAMALVFMVIAVQAKASNNTLAPLIHLSMVSRLAQSCHGVWFYLAKSALPVGLSAYYPLPRGLDFSGPPFLASAMLVVGISVGAFVMRRRWPGLGAAWLSYVVILAPNLGIVRIGDQLAADRYGYMATIPMVVLLGYGLVGPMRSRPRRVAVVGLGALVVLTAQSWRQCRVWGDSASLWRDALARGADQDVVVRVNLGAALADRGRQDEAREQFEAALRISPGYGKALANLGMILDRQGNGEEALAYFARALRADPGDWRTEVAFGDALYRRDRVEEARGHYARAVKLMPGSPEAHSNLGQALSRLGREEEARRQFEAAARLAPGGAEVESQRGLAAFQRGRFSEALGHYAAAARLAPGSAAARNDLGATLARLGRFDEAQTQFVAALRLQPDSDLTLNNLAQILTMQGRDEEALRYRTTAARLSSHSAEAQSKLGDALGRLGRLDEAAAAFSRALRLAPGHPGARQGLAEIRRLQATGGAAPP